MRISVAPRDVSAFVHALRGVHLRRSLVVAAIVGTLLTLINQWDACVGDAKLAWMPLILTYCVPFCVATYGTFSGLRRGA